MHSVVAIAIMSKFIMIVGEINILATCLISGFAIVALYGGYFLMTFFSARKMAVRK